jgi:iron complex outermembrane recepter protein
MRKTESRTVSSAVRTILRTCLTARAAALALLVLPSIQPVYAEAGPTEGASNVPASNAPAAELEEIVVTAQFRAQGAQDTPLSITAVSANDIQARGMSDVTDVASEAPNVVIRPGGTIQGPSAQAFIRGVGQSDSSFAFEPGVGIYVDDVYYGTLLGSIFELVDLDRIEVLRGPQGTLAGKNSMGGAVKLFSKKPTGEDNGYVDAQYGSFNHVELKGSADFSVIPEKLMVRLSGVSDKQDGYLARLDYGCLHPGSGVAAMTTSASCKLGTDGGRNLQAGRMAVRWLATDSLEVNLRGTITSEDSEPAATKLLGLTTHTNIPASINPAVFVTGPNSFTSYATYANPAFSDPARYAAAAGAGAHGATAVNPNTVTRGRDVSGKVDWTLAEGLVLTSITAYQDYWGSYATDIDETPYGVNTAFYTWEHKQFTQELRLNGTSFDNFVDWTVGGFYYDATSYFGGVNYNSPGQAGENLYVLNDSIPVGSASAFAHAVWNLTSKLELTTGIRYTRDRKSYHFHRLDPYDLALPAYTPAGAIDGISSQYKGSRVDYRADLSYHWTSGFMTYAQYSTGYKGGGVNPRPYVLQQAVPFAPETLTAYEVGFKSDLFGRKLRVNGAVFLNLYHDMVFINTTPTAQSTLNATPVNAGSGEYRGAELEVSAFPVARLRVDLSGSYLHFKLTNLSGAGLTIAGLTLNNKSPYAPQWKESAAVEYSFPFKSAGTLTPRVDFSYESSFFSDINNDPTARVSAYGLVNGRLTWSSDDDKWEVAAAGSNLANRYCYENKLHYPIGSIIGQPGMPRTWSIDIRRSFL